MYYSNSYYCGGADEFIVRYVFADGSVEFLDGIGPGSRGTYGNPAISPDGTLLAYDKEYDEVGGATHVGISIVALDGSGRFDFREVEKDRQLAFAPSQTRVALVKIPARRIVLASIHGRHRDFLTRGTQPSWQPVG